MKILFFGDIVGRPGRKAVKKFLAEDLESVKPDLIIANADNLASGRGPTLSVYEDMLEAGIDVLTCGDHIWDNREAVDIMQLKNSKLIRPMNYPSINPGKGFIEVEVNGKPVVIASFLGRVFTTEGLDSPFTIANQLVEEHKNKTIIIDFHAEATSEKSAFGNFVSGKVSAVLGTHTHVQTADHRILEDFTAYISDVGSCSPYDSVIGVDKAISIKRFVTGVPIKFELADGPVQVNAVVVEIDDKSGAAYSITPINKVYED